MDEKNYMKGKELCAAGIFPGPENSLRVKVMKREIPFIKIGRSVWFDPTEVTAWVDAHRVPVGGKSE